MWKIAIIITTGLSIIVICPKWCCHTPAEAAAWLPQAYNQCQKLNLLLSNVLKSDKTMM